MGNKFSKLIENRFLVTGKLHKIFNENAIKVSYCCMDKVIRQIKKETYTKKIVNARYKLQFHVTAAIEMFVDKFCY